MKTTLVCSLLAAVAAASAQVTFQRTYGGPADDWGYSVAQTADGGYVITGYTGSFGAGGHDFWLLRTDSIGDTVWSRTFGGPERDDAFSVAQTADSGYIVAGYTESYGAGGADVWLIKTDANGNKTWDRTFGGSRYDYGYSVQQTADGGYIIAGYTRSYGAGEGDVWLVKTDASGNKSWDRTFGGSLNDRGYSVQQTADGGFIITGRTDSYGAGYLDVWVIKTDVDGSKTWDRTFGGSYHDEGYSGQQTADDGFIITGRTHAGAGDAEAWLIKTDVSGNRTWDRAFGGRFNDRGYSVQQTADSGYIVAGCTESYGAGGTDVWLIKTDAGGNKSWDRTLGGSEWDEGRAVQQTADGGYVIAGYTRSHSAGVSDVWLIKTDSLGRIGIAEQEPVEVENQPGPTVIRAAELARYEGRILDALGREVRFSTSDFGVRTSHLPPGVYFIKYEVQTPNAELGTRKVIVTR